MRDNRNKSSPSYSAITKNKENQKLIREIRLQTGTIREYRLVPCILISYNLQTILFCYLLISPNGKDYSQWCRSMTIALSAKLKLGMENGSCPKPDPNSPLLQYWDGCSTMVIYWIPNSASPKISSSISTYGKTNVEWLGYKFHSKPRFKSLSS